MKKGTFNKVIRFGNIILQQFIDGKTVQEYLDCEEISSKDKLIPFEFFF